KGKGGATFVPIPAAEGDETRAAHKTLVVVIDDVFGMCSGNKPPDDDGTSGAVGIGGGNFENIQTRTAGRSLVLHLKGAGNLHDQFQRRLGSVSQIAYLRRTRAIFVTHRQVVQQIFNGGRSVFLDRMARELGR